MGTGVWLHTQYVPETTPLGAAEADQSCLCGALALQGSWQQEKDLENHTKQMRKEKKAGSRRA